MTGSSKVDLSAANIANVTQTSGIGTGADGTTPSGAEHTLVTDDIAALIVAQDAILTALENAGIVRKS